MAAINFPANPSNGDTHQGFVYNSTLGVWQSAGTQTAVTSFTGLSDTPSTLGTAGQIAKVNSGATALEFADQSGVTVYANVDALPGSGNTGDLAFVTATNRLYLWNGSGWYNIALINTTPSISGVNSSYALASDGTATVITITAVDAEGLPITYSIASDTSGNIATVTQGTGASSNVFTITPSTNTADAGSFSLTFRASDGVNIASSIASFELAFRVVNSNYTTALITSVGANLATNNDFVDSSTNSHTITAAGNATQTTFSPYRHGGYSTYFDGSSSLSVTNTGSTLAFGTGDVTVEGWINQSLAVGTQYAILADLNVSGVGPVAFWYNGTVGTGAEFRLGAANLTQMIGFRVDTPINEWFHFAYVRASGTWRFYLNGTEITTRNTDVGDADGYSFANFNPNVGSFTNGLNMAGYMTDLRVVVGTAVYTSAFTPPTERLTAITNTGLLTCHLPYIADGSTNSHSITINGNTKTEPFAPYDTQEYSATDHGGSTYLDGTGDYVKATNTTTSVSGDFTIECWVNFTSYAPSGANSRVFSMKPGGNTTDNLQLIVGISSPAVAGSVSVWTNAYICHGSTVVSDGSWHHIVVTRESGTVKLYIDGALDGSGSNSTTFDFSGHKIGTRDETTDATSKYSGSIADFRTVVGTAVYTSNFTPPTAPLTDITNTLALVRGTNAGIIDKAQSVQTLTLNGDVKSSTTQTKYLSSSMYFDGSGDYISTDPIVLTNTEPFTIEMWYYNTSSGTGEEALICQRNSASPYNGWRIYNNQSATNQLRFYNGTGWVTIESNLAKNQWHHIAVVSQGSGTNQGQCYLNGTAAGSAFTTSSSINHSADLHIGTDNAVTSRTITGYLSDVRITKGLARYTANFTPPTAELKG